MKAGRSGVCGWAVLRAEADESCSAAWKAMCCGEKSQALLEISTKERNGGLGGTGRLCLESNKTRRLRGEQGVPLGVLIDSRELDLHAESEFQVTNCGVPIWKYVFIWSTQMRTMSSFEKTVTYISPITAFQLFLVLERMWACLEVVVFLGGKVVIICIPSYLHNPAGR